MKTQKETKFLDMFPGHVFRYIDLTGDGRAPVSSVEKQWKLNRNGYESYFTVNGFEGAPDARKEHCTSLNAFFIDIDGRKDLDELEEIKKRLMPTFIIETMNGHHIYWLLDEPIFKNEISESEWQQAVTNWERIEQSIVTALKSDPVVKDITRILRVPDTYYWKKCGVAWKMGIEAALFKIKGVHKDLSATYTMAQVEDAFPDAETSVKFDDAPVITDKMKRYAEAEKKDFFDRVNEKYAIEDRPSFKALSSGMEGTLPEGLKSRNEALLITASLMRQAGWSQKDAIAHFTKVGWHGIEKEAGGKAEIANTVNSAYRGGYTYSYKNPIIAFNMTPEEQTTIINVYTAVAKERREVDKTRYSNYEHEIFARYPYLKKNSAGMVFNYVDGVYIILSDQDLSNLVLNCLYEDMLWGYRTKHAVNDKVACLISIIPDFVETSDKGVILNCKNGLLNIFTRELKPHTPSYMSLVQTPVIYDPSATAPTWIECMKAWMAGDEQQQKTLLLQQFAGYCLSSSTKYSTAMFLVGDGGNGKSTFADTIAMVIGSRATSRIDLEDLYNTFGFAGLIGKRVNIVEEVSGNYYQSHKLKKVISGEEITVNIKYKDQFKFEPQAKFIFAVNTMPRVDDSSMAMERRIAIVQFANNFRDNPNVDLRFSGGTLAKELPGILNWMLEGVKSLKQNNGFVKTIEQTNLLFDYRQENSSIEGFIHDCLEKDDHSEVDTRKMYEVYKEYCIKDGRKPKQKQMMTKELKAYGKRTKEFKFKEREHGHELAKFTGVKINEIWNATPSVYGVNAF